MLKINKKESTVYVESIKRYLRIKYGKKHFFKLDLVDVLYQYFNFNSIKDVVSMREIKNVFDHDGVDLEVTVNVNEREEIEVKK